MAYTRQSKQANNRIQVIVFGILIVFVCTIVLTSVLSAVIENQIIREENARYIIPVIQLLSTLGGSYYGIKKAERKYFIYAGVIAGVYAIVIGALNVIAFDGLFESFVPGILFVMFGALIACVIRMVPNKEKYRRRH